jgi:hypothetical protein
VITIIPYEAVGQIRFGMSLDDVISMLGRPDITDEDRSGEVMLYFGALNVTITSEGVAEVGILPQIPVTIGDVSVFSDPEALEKLCRMDGEPKESLGIVILYNLGISMGGFHDFDESQKAVTAFSRGRWDFVRSETRDFRVAGS